jgi:hypothetical protein
MVTMKMKGRFRKGKKAFRSVVNRQPKLRSRYLRWLYKREASRKSAITIALAAQQAWLAAFRFAQIMSRPSRTEEDRVQKAVAIASVAIDAASGIQKAFNILP